MIRIRVYESDGSDGYSSGTWGYIIHIYDSALDVACCDGGYASQQLAMEAARRRMGEIER